MSSLVFALALMADLPLPEVRRRRSLWDDMCPQQRRDIMASDDRECPPVPEDCDHCPVCGEWDLVGSGHEIEEW